MAVSWHVFIGHCKSRISAIARSCYLGREGWKRRYVEEICRLNARLEELQSECNAANVRVDQLSIELEVASERAVTLEKKVAELKCKPIQLPDDPPPPGQQYGASFMALCINLARDVGLRKSVRATRIFFDWLKVKHEIPTYQAIRTWMQRVGLDRVQTVKPKSDRIWFADHSNQVGQEKCLTILGIEQSKLPPAGKPLKLSDMTMLTVFPSKVWNRENVSKIYQRVAKKFGSPIAVVSDGAVELREPVKMLGKAGKEAISIRDMKHFLANRLEGLLSKDDAFQSFTRDSGQVRSSMHQTELSHLSPPSMRQKSRFMNLEPILRWSRMALWQLDHPKSDGRKGVSEKRITEKLGWLKKYRNDVERWNGIQDLVSKTLTYINENGLKHGTAKELKTVLRQIPKNEATGSLMKSLMKFVQEYEAKLKPGQRLPMSSEILESSFAKFKMFEQLHARSGFTQVLLGFPCLLKRTNAAEVKRAFGRTKITDVKAWTDKHLPKTHDARRQAAYRECRNSLKNCTKQKRATCLAATG